MKIREKLDIKWSPEVDEWLRLRYDRIDKAGIELVSMFCNVARDNIYKGRDLTGLKIAAVYSVPVGNAGLKYAAADEDSEVSAKEVGGALERRGMVVEYVRLTDKNIADLENVEADVVFNLCEWTGRDLYLTEKVFGIMKKKGMVYTGSEDVGDKWEMKKKLVKAGVRTPEWQILETGDGKLDIGLRYPVIVKPILEHCSIGLSQSSVVVDEKRLREQVMKLIEEFEQPVLVEEFIDGSEFQVTVLERGGEIKVLPPAEINYKRGRRDWPLLTYDVRWDEKLADENDPSEDVFVPVLEKKLSEKIEVECRKAFVGCELTGYGRADMRVRDGEVYMLEINSNPGLGDHYSYGVTLSQWTHGMTFSDLCFWVVTAAMERFGKI